jgi:hypothetical protein
MINVPISFGELIDKITILKIKKNKITDSLKLSNVTKEYDLLLKIMIENHITEDHELFLALYQLNLEFWEYHDWQREKWNQMKNRPNLIDYELYKKNEEEHIMNDKRAEIKKKINLLFSSEIIEEKQFKNYCI